jgi:hypothetical protein
MGCAGNVRKLIKILTRAPSTSVIYSIDFDLIADTAQRTKSGLPLAQRDYLMHHASSGAR